MSQTTHPDDLLALIARAIDHLRCSIDFFEAADQGAGIEELSTVVHDIDTYLDRIHTDPLLNLASLPAGRVRDGLLSVSDDLSTVIRQVEEQPS